MSLDARIFTPFTHLDLVFPYPEEILTTRAVVEDGDAETLRLGVANLPPQLQVGEQLFLTLVRQGEACYSAPTTVMALERGRTIVVAVPDEDDALRIQTRSFFRIKAALTVMIQPESGPGFMTWSRDLSAGGMLVETIQPLTVGQRVMVGLDLQDQEVDLYGRVVRVMPGASALVFERISDAEQSRLVRTVQLLEQRLRKGLSK